MNLKQKGIEDVYNLGKVRANAWAGDFQPIIKLEGNPSECCTPSEYPCLDVVTIPAADAGKNIVSIVIGDNVVQLTTPVPSTNSAMVVSQFLSAFQKPDPQEFNIKNIVETASDGSVTISHIGRLTLASVTLDDGTVRTGVRTCTIIEACNFTSGVAIGGDVDLVVGANTETIDASNATTLESGLQTAFGTLGINLYEVVVEDFGNEAVVTILVPSNFEGTIGGKQLVNCGCCKMFG